MSAILNRVASSTNETNVAVNPGKTHIHLYTQNPGSVADIDVAWNLADQNPIQDALGEFDVPTLRPIVREDGVYLITLSVYLAMNAATTQVSIYLEDPPGASLNDERGNTLAGEFYNDTAGFLLQQRTLSAVVRFQAGEAINVRHSANNALTTVELTMVVVKIAD